MPTPDAFGRAAFSHDRNGLRVAEVATPPRLALGPHRHEAAQICCVLGGDYSEDWSTERKTMRAGDLFYRPAGWVHSNCFGRDEVVTLLISIDPSLAPPDVGVPLRFASPEPHRLAMTALQALRDGDADQLDGLGRALIASTRPELQALEADPPLVHAAARCIEAEHASPLSLSILARRLGVHRVTLAERFRRARGMTVGAYIRAVRLRRAAAALLTQDSRVAAIAHANGFADESHLARLFRRAFGRSPAAFRAAARPGRTSADTSIGDEP